MDVIKRALEEGATDLHLEANGLAMMRVLGRLETLGPCSAENFEQIEGALYNKRTMFDSILRVERDKVKDFSSALDGGVRLRVRRYFALGHACLAIRFLPQAVPSAQALGWPVAMHQLSTLRHGLVLITGPTGSGKSTTLAAILDAINHSRACHIVTYENPVEYILPQAMALVHQRQVPEDVESFEEGAREAMRLDPDVIMLGELTTEAAMRAALALAESGHLVLATMHASSASNALRYFIHHFEAREQAVVREQLAEVLQAVITQRLVPSADSTKLLGCYEVLLHNRAVENIIRNGDLAQLEACIENNRSDGMMLLEESLAKRVRNGELRLSDARMVANHPEAIGRFLE